MCNKFKNASISLKDYENYNLRHYLRDGFLLVSKSILSEKVKSGIICVINDPFRDNKLKFKFIIIMQL